MIRPYELTRDRITHFTPAAIVSDTWILSGGRQLNHGSRAQAQRQLQAGMTSYDDDMLRSGRRS